MAENLSVSVVRGVLWHLAGWRDEPHVASATVFAQEISEMRQIACEVKRVQHFADDVYLLVYDGDSHGSNFSVQEGLIGSAGLGRSFGRFTRIQSGNCLLSALAAARSAL